MEEIIKKEIIDILNLGSMTKEEKKDVSIIIDSVISTYLPIIKITNNIFDDKEELEKLKDLIITFIDEKLGD